MNKPTLEQIEKVAEWWAEKTFDLSTNQDNGDESLTGILTMSLAENLRSLQLKDKASDSRSKFKDSITSTLTNNSNFLLMVDYDPNTALADACIAAGVGFRVLPIKTHTQWNGTNFIGRFGYGAPFETIA